ISVTRVARGLRVREDHLHVITHKVIPVLDVLRVAFAHQEGRHRIEGRRLVAELALPIFRNETTLNEGIDVRYLIEGHDISLKALQDGAGLARRTTVRLVDRLARIDSDIGFVDLREQLTRNVIGRVQDLVRLLGVQRRYDGCAHNGPGDEQGLHRYPQLDV